MYNLILSNTQLCILNIKILRHLLTQVTVFQLKDSKILKIKKTNFLWNVFQNFFFQFVHTLRMMASKYVVWNHRLLLLAHQYPFKKT